MCARLTLRRALTLACATLIAVTAAASGVRAQNASRPMTFLDMRQMRSVGSPTPSPDGRWLLYTLSTPDWKEAKSQTDLYLVSMQQGVSSTRQMTFTKEKNESVAALGERRPRVLLPLQPRGAGKRRVSQSALHHAARRRRGAAPHRRARRRARLSVQPDGRDAGVSQRQGWRGAALSPAGQRHRDGDRGAVDQASRPASAPGSGRPTASASTFSRPTRSTRTRRNAARRSSPSTSATWRRHRPACGRSISNRDRHQES